MYNEVKQFFCIKWQMHDKILANKKFLQNAWTQNYTVWTNVILPHIIKNEYKFFAWASTCIRLVFVINI